MRKILLISTILALVSANTAETMASVWKLFQNWSTFSPQADFWYYTLLQLQDDTSDTSSDCIVKYGELDTLLTTTYTEITTLDDPSDAYSADYKLGIETKGNGSPTPFGFAMYKALKYTDVVLEGVDLYEKCKIEDYMLALGYSITSVTGAIQIAISFAYRYWPQSDEEKANYASLDAAVDANDAAAAGSAFGYWFKTLLQTELASEHDTTTYYDFIGYI